MTRSSVSSVAQTARHGLSKSRIAAFEQCPKRLWLQVHRPGLAETDGAKALRFAAGHEVGEVACALLPNGIMIEAEPDLAAATVRTAELLSDPARVPLFEATFVHDGVLVRLDIMEPADDGGWHVAEVKSSTARKDCYIADLATQLWVLRENGVVVSSAAIRHINNQFVLVKESDYSGLLVDVDTLEEAAAIAQDRPTVIAAARAVLAGGEPELSKGEHCDAPYSCEFGSYCTGCKGDEPAWPVSLLPNTGRKIAASWAEKGVFELTELPDDSLKNPLHARIRQVTIEGAAYHDFEGARRATAEWLRPRSYLDFETISFAVPRWVGTRPWQQVPFQFSVHVESEGGELHHREYLGLDGQDPRRECAEALIAALPATGAIVAYNAGFERGCIKQLAASCPDLAPELEQIAERVVDLLPVTRDNWYHRDQRGSWSIKSVLPTIPCEASYKTLDVADGSAAQTAYLEAIDPACDPARRDALEQDLRAYCALDTLAMVNLLDHLTLQGREA